MMSDIIVNYKFASSFFICIQCLYIVTTTYRLQFWYDKLHLLANLFKLLNKTFSLQFRTLTSFNTNTSQLIVATAVQLKSRKTIPEPFAPK
jgi:hypothetical protein